VKEGELHHVYEEQRLLPAPTDVATREAWHSYDVQMAAIAAKIPVPPGVTQVG
jgi:hypothetical protein